LLSFHDASTFAVFLDNCRVHHSKKVQKFAAEHNIIMIFNAPYSPEFNPIERVWSQMKLQFKKMRVEAIISGRSPNYQKMIQGILINYPKHKIISLCKGTFKSKLDV
jgi:transposase